jgi:hypothetical protein
MKVESTYINNNKKNKEFVCMIDDVPTNSMLKARWRTTQVMASRTVDVVLQ